MKKIIIGTRSSELALWQANYVKNALKNSHPSIEIELKHVKTKGDKILDKALSKIGDKGLFTKEFTYIHHSTYILTILITHYCKYIIAIYMPKMIY